MRPTFIVLMLLALLTLSLVIACGDDDDDNDDNDAAADDDGVDDDAADDDAVDDDAVDDDTIDDDDDFPRTYSSGTLTGCTGEIAYNYWEYDGAAETTLVFVNGRTEYTDKYHHIVPMVDRPWNIVMWDHYGQGYSNGPRAHAEDFDTQHVCDMRAVIDQLADATLPIVVIAHSMGGFIATRFAELNPEVADVYVFSSPMYGIVTDPFPPDLARSLSELMTSMGKGEVHAPGDTPGIDPPVPFEENVLTHDEELYNAWAYDPVTLIGQPTFGWTAAAFASFDEMFADAALVQQKFLIMQAGMEYLVLPELHGEFCALMNAQNADSCSVFPFANDYHELFNELDREEVMDTALAFIDAALAK